MRAHRQRLTIFYDGRRDYAAAISAVHGAIIKR